MKPLLMMRTRGIAGVVMTKVVKLTKAVAKSSGAAISAKVIVTPVP